LAAAAMQAASLFPVLQSGQDVTRL